MKKWIPTFALAIAFAIMALIDPQLGRKGSEILLENVITLISILPAIFIIIGLLDAWVSREHMVKYLGEHSGLAGYAGAFLLGFFAAGPLYVAFPIAAILIKKGARLGPVFFFMGVWSTSKLPFLMYELKAFGVTFTLLHLIAGLGTFFIASLILEKSFTPEKRAALEKRVADL